MQKWGSRFEDAQRRRDGAPAGDQNAAGEPRQANARDAGEAGSYVKQISWNVSLLFMFSHHSVT